MNQISIISLRKFFFNFVGFSGFEKIIKIKINRIIKIGHKMGRRNSVFPFVQKSHYFFIFIDFHQFLSNWLWGIFDNNVFNLVRTFHFQLGDETAFFACIYARTQRIVKQMNIFRILDQSVKVISINTVIFQESIQAEILANIKRNVSILSVS